MQLGLSPHTVDFHSSSGFRELKLDVQTANQLNRYSPFLWKKSKQWRKQFVVTFAFLENTASVVVAATVVGAAATLLIRTNKAPETANEEKPVKVCEDCGGSGICAECKGEGFVLKKLSDENAERARLSAKNMATRYTAGLPKKWSYCTKCSSARSCSTCGGSGQLIL